MKSRAIIAFEIAMGIVVMIPIAIFGFAAIDYMQQTFRVQAAIDDVFDRLDAAGHRVGVGTQDTWLYIDHEGVHAELLRQYARGMEELQARFGAREGVHLEVGYADYYVDTASGKLLRLANAGNEYGCGCDGARSKAIYLYPCDEGTAAEDSNLFAAFDALVAGRACQDEDSDDDGVDDKFDDRGGDPYAEGSFERPSVFAIPTLLHGNPMQQHFGTSHVYGKHPLFRNEKEGSGYRSDQIINQWGRTKYLRQTLIGGVYISVDLKDTLGSKILNAFSKKHGGEERAHIVEDIRLAASRRDFG